MQPAETPSPAPVAARTTKGPSKAQAAFQRGLAALTQWVEREGDRSVPRGHSEQITVNGEPVSVKLGVWVSNTKSRRDKLTPEQLDALRMLGMHWAGVVPAVDAAPKSPAPQPAPSAAPAAGASRGV